MARTASRCTCGSASSSSSDSSRSASSPPKIRSRSDGGAAHGRLGRVLERLDGAPPLGAERDQQLADAADGVGMVLGGQRLGERQHQPRPDRLAHPGQRLRVGVAGLAELGDDVAHQRPAGQRVERRVRLVAQRTGRAAPRCAASASISRCAPAMSPSIDRRSISRTVSSATPLQLSGSVSIVIRSSVSSRSRSRTAASLTEASHAAMRSGGSSDRRSTSIACARARVSSRAYSDGHEALVRVVEHHHRALPHLGEARVRSELGLLGLGAGQLEQRSLAVGVRHEGLEHLGQPLGGAALGRRPTGRRWRRWSRRRCGRSRRWRWPRPPAWPPAGS